MKLKNSILQVTVASSCLLSTPAWLAAQKPDSQRPMHYHVTDLGTLGGPVSMAFSVSNAGVLSGGATLTDGTEHAVLWYKRLKIDLGTPGLNSVAYTVNASAEAVGSAEYAQEKDSENFCGFGSDLVCLPVRWEEDGMTSLPTPGGRNGAAVSINDWGRVTGVAEEITADPHCISPQTHDFKAMVWGPRKGEMQKLRPFPGDSVGIGLWINNWGQVVGVSGSCGDTILPPLASGPRAVLWEHGSVLDLGNLGGDCVNGCKSDVLGPFGNTALYISNRGHVVGLSALSGEKTFHAFLWKRGATMQDLGVLQGDLASVGIGANNRGEVVGASFDAKGSPRAFLRRDGEMIDLNTLLPANAPIYALVAQFINERGEIAGFGVNAGGETHAFLAVPCPYRRREVDGVAEVPARTRGRPPDWRLIPCCGIAQPVDARKQLDVYT